MNMFIRSHPRFKIEAEKAKAVLRAAKVVASDETGVRIEGTNSYHWVFHCEDAVVHQPDYSRAVRVVDEMMDGHAPAVWISDRYSAQQLHGERHQTCLAHLARDTAFALHPNGRREPPPALVAIDMSGPARCLFPGRITAPDLSARGGIGRWLPFVEGGRRRRDTTNTKSD